MPSTCRTASVETALPADTLLLQAMQGNEELGRLFEYRVDLLGERDDVALSDLLGTYMTVSLQLLSGSVRYFHGLVTEFGRVSAREPGERHARYRAVLRPSFWLLTRSADCRIFQNMSVPEIVKQVLEEHGVQEVEDALTGSYRCWDYLVQYRETAFDFLSRLMEQEGLYYYFRHQHGRHTLVLADAASSHEPAPGYEQVSYFPPGRHDQHAHEHLSLWTVLQRIETGTYTLHDFDFTRPNADLEAQLSAPKQHAHADLERFDYPGEYVQTADGEGYARVRLEELQAGSYTVQAAGNVRGLFSGGLFSLSGYPGGRQTSEHLVVSVQYQIEGGAYESGDACAPEVFSCSLSAITSDVPFRSARTTPKPVVAGPQTATVVGKAGEEIWTDEYGRVKVLFHWDRGGRRQADENTTCWIRVAQLWAGSGWGGMHIPRVGQEVVVEFLEGDPDRPLVTGRLYNAKQMPPYPLPGGQTQSGLKSRSSKGGGQDNANEIRFEDKKGDEQLYVQAEKNLDLFVKRDETHRVGANRTRTVERDESIRVSGSRTKTVSKSEDITIEQAETIAVTKSFSLDVGESATVSVGKDFTLTVGKNEQHDVTEARTVTIGKDDQLDVGGGRKQQVAKDELLDVGKKLTIKAGDQIVLKAGDASITLKKNGNITIEGKDIVLKGSGKIQVTASGQVSLKGSKVSGN